MGMAVDANVLIYERIREELRSGKMLKSAVDLGFKGAMSAIIDSNVTTLMTAIILGTARGIGETSPVLLTAGFTAALNLNPTTGPMVSLPLATFEFVKSPEPTMIARGFGTAAVLMFVVLILFIIARIIGGRGPGNLSKSQQKRRAKRSREDSQRFTKREATRVASQEAAAGPSSSPRSLDFGDSRLSASSASPSLLSAPCS